MLYEFELDHHGCVWAFGDFECGEPVRINARASIDTDPDGFFVDGLEAVCAKRIGHRYHYEWIVLPVGHPLFQPLLDRLEELADHIADTLEGGSGFDAVREWGTYDARSP